MTHPAVDLNTHVIVVDRDGKALQAAARPSVLSRSAFERHCSPMIDGLRSAPLRNGRRQVLLYVHGGMNTYAGSLERARMLCKPIADAGFFPIFVNWRSGLVSCYLEHLFRVRQGRTHRGWWWITWVYYLLADLGRAVFRVPAALYLQIINDMKPYFPGSNPDGLNASAIYHALRARQAAAHNGDDPMQAPPALGVSLGRDVRSVGQKTALALRLVLSTPAKIVSGALIDAVGTSAWSNMLRRTKTLFRAPSEFDIRDRRDNREEVERVLDTEPTGALATFLRELSDMIASSPDEYELTLMGHSMGTIVLNQVLRDFPELPCRDIVYMAAACSTSECIESVMPYLEKNPEARFYNLCLHPVAEETEANAFELAPRGSLLVWIDNFLSLPYTTPDRRLGVWENVLQTTHLIPEQLRGRVVIKGFSAGSTADKPQKHGAFDEVEFWRREFWQPEDPR